MRPDLLRHGFKLRLYRTFALVMCVAACLFGCVRGDLVSQQQDVSLYQQQSSHKAFEGDLTLYRLTPGDVLDIRVFEEEDLSGTFKTSADGTISYPLLGAVHVADLSISEVRVLLEARLRDGYLKKPAVIVDIAAFKPFSVLGAVKDAGNFEYRIGLSAADAIAMSGGFTASARQDNFEVLRRGDHGAWQQLYITITDPIFPGDVVYVRERLF